MKPLLRQLYDGELYPAAETQYFSKRLVMERDAHYTHMEEFYNTLKDLSPDLYDRLDKLMDEREAMYALELEDTFLYGFRLGMTLLAEALYP